MLTLEKFEEASEVVRRVTLETKLVYSDYFSQQTGAKVFFKPENLQFTGAYKVRGAGRCLCCKVLWRESYNCNADNHASD